jgi:hypothetical protein
MVPSGNDGWAHVPLYVWYHDARPDCSPAGAAPWVAPPGTGDELAEVLVVGLGTGTVVVAAGAPAVGAAAWIVVGPGSGCASLS